MSLTSRPHTYFPAHSRTHSNSGLANHNTDDVDNDNNNKNNNSNDPIIKSTDMNEQMQQHATQIAVKAIEQMKQSASPSVLHTSVARLLKKEFDAIYGGIWHCVVGRNFGSFVVHEAKTFIYLYIGPIAILLFRSGTQ